MSALQMLTTEITKLLSIGQVTDKLLMFQFNCNTKGIILLSAVDCHGTVLFHMFL